MQSGSKHTWSIKYIKESDDLNARIVRKRTKGALKIAFRIARAVFLFSLCLVLLYPILVMLSISLRRISELYDPTVVWIPKHFTIQSYIDVWTILGIGRVLINTAVISVLGTASQLIPCVLAGYGFARFKFPGKKILFGLLILTIMVPPQIVAIPSMTYFQKFDFFFFGQIAKIFTGTAATVTLSNTIFAYLLPAILGCGIKSGLFIFIFIQFFRGLPGDLQDAAYIDGCGRFRTFVQIMIPLSGAAILTVTLFSLVWYWNDNYFSMVFFDGLKTVSTVLQDVRNQLSNSLTERNELALIPQMQAAAMISMLPLVTIYVILQKYFTESIERTGIVG